MSPNAALSGLTLDCDTATEHPYSLADASVSGTLARLHARANRQSLSTIPVIARLAWDRLRGHKTTGAEEATMLRNIFLPVSRNAGAFLYLIARASGATKIVEYGTSFGISTIYLAAAVRDNGGGHVIGSELEPGKVRQARAHLALAGLDSLVEIREGEALATLRNLNMSVDLLLLDGWKAQYLDILRLVSPFLHYKSVVLADDVIRFPKPLARYVEHVRQPENGFSSVTIPIDEGIEYSLRVK